MLEEKKGMKQNNLCIIRFVQKVSLGAQLSEKKI